MKSQKEMILDEKLVVKVKEIVQANCPEDDLPVRIMEELISNPEVKAIQDYSNNVSINRLGFNDHGPVHMRIVCQNALRIIGILKVGGIGTSLQNEGAGTFADSLSAVIIAAMMHDAGMTIGRKDHELYSGIITCGLITGILEKLLPGEENVIRRTVIRSVALEGIIGHMGTRSIHSLEAGIILVSDGCDMTKGRARIPLEHISKASEGDIHKYSAGAIEAVRLRPGEEKPLRIIVEMKESVGFFQIEEVLIPKIKASSLYPHIELYAGVIGEDTKRYL